MEGPNADIAARVSAFYDRHPYPPPLDDLDAYRRLWDEQRRRAESHLFWPAEPYRENRSILVAGCGTTQAAHYAVRWPRAHLIGIDVSAKSIAFAQKLKRKYALDNLELRQLAVERADELGETFEHVVCTGVLHHLADPDEGLRALREVLEPAGALHVMVYAPYGRAGIYMIQDYCRRLGIGRSDVEIAELAASLKALSPDHPLAPLLRNSPDFADRAGLADALLHPKIEPIRSRSSWVSSNAPAWRSGAGSGRRRTCHGAARRQACPITTSWLSYRPTRSMRLSNSSAERWCATVP